MMQTKCLNSNKAESKKSEKIIKSDYYFEHGLMVFTEYYHLKRGFCCGNKCRHCPYQKEAK